MAYSVPPSCLFVAVSDFTETSAPNTYIGIGKVDVKNGNLGSETKLSDLEDKVQSRLKVNFWILNFAKTSILPRTGPKFVWLGLDL